VCAQRSELDEWKRKNAFSPAPVDSDFERRNTRLKTAELPGNFAKIFGTDRTIYLIYSELTLNPLVSKIVARYDRLVLEGRSVDREIGDHELRMLLRSKPLVTYQPDQKHGSDGYNFRAEHSACVCEVRASAYVASMLSEYQFLKVHVVGTTDGDVYGKRNITFISFGTLINSKTQDLLDDPRALVGFRNGCFVSNREGRPLAPTDKDTRRPLHPHVTDDGPEDYGVILRMEPTLPRRYKGHVWIACAGVQQMGTSAAAFVLANDWESISEKLVSGGGNFVSLVKVTRAKKDQYAKLVWTVESLEELARYEL
jgi:hypothetical protein